MGKVTKFPVQNDKRSARLEVGQVGDEINFYEQDEELFSMSVQQFSELLRHYYHAIHADPHQRGEKDLRLRMAEQHIKEAEKIYREIDNERPEHERIF